MLAHGERHPHAGNGDMLYLRNCERGCEGELRECKGEGW